MEETTKKHSDELKKLETTLGDLIVALTEEATQFVRDEKDAYKLVAFALMHLLYNSGRTPKECQMWQ